MELVDTTDLGSVGFIPWGFKSPYPDSCSLIGKALGCGPRVGGSSPPRLRYGYFVLFLYKLVLRTYNFISLFFIYQSKNLSINFL